MRRAWCLLVIAAGCDDARLVANGNGPSPDGAQSPDAQSLDSTATPSPDAMLVTPDAPAQDGPPASHIAALSVGGYHSCAIVDGAVQCWGQAYSGRLGTGDPATVDGGPYRVVGLTGNVTAISAGGWHTCAIVDGSVWCWGGNAEGELGNPGVGALSSTTPVPVLGLPSGVTAIAASDEHTCAIVQGGVMCWGDNSNAELGVTGVTQSDVPVWVTNLGPGSGVTSIVANGWNTCVILNGGQWCWGDNYNGQLGLGDGLPVKSPVPLQPPSLASGVTAIGIGSDRFICTVQNGAVYCAGHNFTHYYGATGPITSTVPMLSPELPAADNLVGGWTFGLAVVGGAVTTFGAGGRGSLFPGGLVVQQVDAGSDHSCAIVGNDVQCWGWNIYAQLGNGPESNTTTYTPSVVGPWAP